MIPAALDRLEASHTALIAALDARDVDVLESVLGSLRAAVEEVRAQGGWHTDPALRDKVTHILGLAEAARQRVGFLTDQNRQRLEALATASGRVPPAVYGRQGQAR